MLHTLQFLIGILIILLITPQTYNDNIVLKNFVETGWFMNYFEAKNFLKIITWGLIFGFIILTFAIHFF